MDDKTLLFLQNGVGDGLVTRTIKAQKNQKMVVKRLYCVDSMTIYFGSQGTYPREMPLTSLTTISRLENSTTVTASNATSSRTSAHSKNA
jgi:hypothetical protein